MDCRPDQRQDNKRDLQISSTHADDARISKPGPLPERRPRSSSPATSLACAAQSQSPKGARESREPSLRLFGIPSATPHITSAGSRRRLGSRGRECPAMVPIRPETHSKLPDFACSSTTSPPISRFLGNLVPLLFPVVSSVCTIFCLLWWWPKGSSDSIVLAKIRKPTQPKKCPHDFTHGSTIYCPINRIF